MGFIICVSFTYIGTESFPDCGTFPYIGTGIFTICVRFPYIGTGRYTLCVRFTYSGTDLKEHQEIAISQLARNFAEARMFFVEMIQDCDARRKETAEQAKFTKRASGNEFSL